MHPTSPKWNGISPPPLQGQNGNMTLYTAEMLNTPKPRIAVHARYREHVCIHVCVHAFFVYVCMYVCMYVCIFVYVYKRMHVYIHTYNDIICMYVCIYALMYAYVI